MRRVVSDLVIICLVGFSLYIFLLFAYIEYLLVTPALHLENAANFNKTKMFLFFLSCYYANIKTFTFFRRVILLVAIPSIPPL